MSIARDRHGFRGTPPPANFSLAALPDDALLTEFEVASALRVSTNTLGPWRRQPDHPLAWVVLPNGLIRYTAGVIRRYLAMGSPRKGRPTKPSSQLRASKPDDAVTTEGAAPPRRRASRAPGKPRAKALAAPQEPPR